MSDSILKSHQLHKVYIDGSAKVNVLKDINVNCLDE